MGWTRLLVSDFIMSFMWVWSGVLVRIFVFKYLGLGHRHLGEIVKAALSITYMFFFAFLAKVTRGGTYNPLTIFADAISGDFTNFLYCVGARIPAQEGLKRRPMIKNLELKMKRKHQKLSSIQRRGIVKLEPRRYAFHCSGRSCVF